MLPSLIVIRSFTGGFLAQSPGDLPRRCRSTFPDQSGDDFPVSGAA